MFLPNGETLERSVYSRNVSLGKKIAGRLFIKGKVKLSL
jgi:hypothetical protein